MSRLLDTVYGRFVRPRSLREAENLDSHIRKLEKKSILQHQSLKTYVHSKELNPSPVTKTRLKHHNKTKGYGFNFSIRERYKSARERSEM